MTLTPVEWGVLVGLVGLGISALGFFLKRTMNQTDKNTKDVQVIQKDYATKDDLDKIKVSCKDHNSEIEGIKRTFVTKEELKDLKTELRDETKKLSEDVAEIKTHYLKKDDFIRSQVETDRKLDRIYNLLIEERRNN